MASLFKRRKSPFWWVKFRDRTGDVKRVSTELRHDIALQTRRARELCAEKTLDERRAAPARRATGWGWVSGFLDSHYAQSPLSHSRYTSAWRTLNIFLEENAVGNPAALTRELCLRYVTWRQTPDKRLGKYRAGHNTAILELKTLSLIIEEARRRGFCRDNPAQKLGIKRAKRKLFAELTDEALALIAEKIESEPEPRRTFLRNSFMIARWHGVRLNETFLDPQRQVWEQEVGGETRWVILFHQKGGREHPKLLHPQLIPLFKQLRAAGAKQTYDRPKDPSRRWFDFMKRHGIKDLLPNACFHSLRVTAASRLARAGVSERKAMEYLTHASTTVHQAYIRWKPEDLDECHGAL